MLTHAVGHNQHLAARFLELCHAAVHLVVRDINSAMYMASLKLVGWANIYQHSRIGIHHGHQLIG